MGAAAAEPTWAEQPARAIQLRTIPEVAASLRVSRAKVENLIYSGRLKSVKIDRSRRVRDDDLTEFIAGLPAGGQPAGGQPADTAEHPDDEPFMDVITHRMITWGEATPEQRLARERWLSELAGQAGSAA